MPSIALVNTISGDDEILGHVISLHETEESAQKANLRLQLQVKRVGGQHSLLPTKIVALKREPRGSAVRHEDIAKVLR